MRIKHFHEQPVDEWKVDPVRGPIKVRQAIVKTSGFHTLSHGGQSFKAARDGCFEVPDELGRVLIGRAGWYAVTGESDEEPEAPRATRKKTSEPED